MGDPRGIERFELGDGDDVIIDTGYLLAWSKSCKFQVGALGGLKTALLTHEGLVARITGPGVVYVQSRAQRNLREWLIPAMGPNVNGKVSS